MQSNFRFKKVWNTINTKNCKCVSDAGLKSYIVSTIFIIYTLCESVERSIYGHSLCLHANTAQCERSMWSFSHYFYEDNRVHLLHTQYLYLLLKIFRYKICKNNNQQHRILCFHSTNCRKYNLQHCEFLAKDISVFVCISILSQPSFKKNTNSALFTEWMTSLVIRDIEG